MRVLIRARALCSASLLPVPGFLLLLVAPFTRPVTPSRDRMYKYNGRVIGLKRQRLIVGFERRHIDQRSHAILAGGDLAASDKARQSTLADGKELRCVARRWRRAVKRSARREEIRRPATAGVRALPAPR